MKFQFFKFPHQQLLLFIFLDIVTLVGVKWPLTVLLICIFLMTNDVEHLSMRLLALRVSSLENLSETTSLFSSLPVKWGSQYLSHRITVRIKREYVCKHLAPYLTCGKSLVNGFLRKSAEHLLPVSPGGWCDD